MTDPGDDGPGAMTDPGDDGRVRFEAITWERLAEAIAARTDTLEPADGGPG